jgi:hypothetical protein
VIRECDVLESSKMNTKLKIENFYSINEYQAEKIYLDKFPQFTGVNNEDFIVKIV